ncbi:MAG TPA: MFS transporter, partial [Ardenticatenaceae bacterium]|nr:MFS transporter [Ardenticatenaceae bacterium]
MISDKWIRLRRRCPPSWLRAALLTVPLLDELISGFPVVALPLIRDDLGLSYAQAGLLFTAGELSAMVLEPGLNAVSDQRSKRVPVVGGMLALSAAFFLAGNAGSYLWLLLAFGLAYPSGGAAVGLSQATLIDEAPSNAARTMTRWTIMAAIGDLLSPLAVALLVTWGLGWRALFWLAAGLWLGAAVALAAQQFPPPAASTDAEEGGAVAAALASLRAAVRTPRLLRWTAVLLFVDMLDEIFLGFAALFLRDVVRAEPAAISLALGAQMTGGVLGLLILDRLADRWPPEQLLRRLAILTAAGIVVFLGARSIWLSAAGLFVIGLGASSWYPIAKA